MGKKSGQGQKPRKGHIKKNKTGQPPTIKANKATSQNGHKGLRQYIWPFILSIAGFIASTYGGNALNNVYPPTGFFIFVLCLCIVFGYWTWKISSRFHNRHPFKSLRIRVLSIILVIVTIVLTSPFYMHAFIKEQGAVEMPLFTDASTIMTVSLGSSTGSSTIQFRVSELRNGELPFVPFDVNGQNLFRIFVAGNRLYVDTEIYGGRGNPPIKIEGNSFYNKPANWRIRQNHRAFEIDDENGVPMFQLVYENPYHIVVVGVFYTTSGLWIVNDTGGMVNSDVPPYVYTAKRIFIRSLWDIFWKSNTYIIE